MHPQHDTPITRPTMPDIAQKIEKLNNNVSALVFINLFIFTPILIYFLIMSFS